MFERFTDRARRTVALAQKEARWRDHNYIGTEHLLLALIHDNEGVAVEALNSLGISLSTVRQLVEEEIGRGQQTPTGHIPFTPRGKKTLELALREALQLGHNYIGTQHLLLGLIREGEGVAAQVLIGQGVDINRIRQYAKEQPGSNGDNIFDLNANTEDVTERVDSMSTNPAFGRAEDLARLIHVLTRADINNPLILGRPGIGKTTLVEGLAWHMSQLRSRFVGRRWRVLEISMDAILVGSESTRLAYAGDLCRALIRNPEVLLFIDDIDAFASEVGSKILFDHLASAIDNSRIQIIATCRSSGLDMMNTDHELWLKLQPISLGEPTRQQSIQMLQSHSDQLQERYKVRLSQAVLASAVDLSADYAPTLGLPASAILLIEDAAAYTRLIVEQTAEVREIESRIKHLNQQIALALAANDRNGLRELEEMAERSRNTLHLADIVDLDSDRISAFADVSLSLAPGTKVPRLPVTTTTPTVAPSQVTPETRRRRSPSRPPERANSTAILLGVGKFADPLLPPLPTTAHNLADLAEAWGHDQYGTFAPERIHMFDSLEHKDMSQIYDLAMGTSDTLLIYYTGHGLSERDDLYLSYGSTVAEKARLTALRYDDLRQIVLDSGVPCAAVILDCCYAGRAIEWMSDGSPSGELDISGAYVLTATASDKKALAKAGERNSAFTGALLRILRQGLDTGSEFIHLDELYVQLLRDLTAGGFPKPRQREDDTIGGLAVARNRRWRTPPARSNPRNDQTADIVTR